MGRREWEYARPRTGERRRRACRTGEGPILDQQRRTSCRFSSLLPTAHGCCFACILQWDKEKTEIKPINITIIGDAAAAQSKATATKQTFAVWAPAQTDPEVQSRRDDVHRGHVINIERLATEGILSAWSPCLLCN